MNASKKGISAHQLHRMLNINYKAAWFMCHRICFAMTEAPLSRLLKGTVEADETYVGSKKRGGKRGRGSENKTPVFALIERGGELRAQKVESVPGKNLKEIIRRNVDPSARLMTDEFHSYTGLDKEFASHETICQGLAENWFSLLKRGVTGTFHHVSSQHLDRYVSEFQFRFKYRKVEDSVRTILAIREAEGKNWFIKMS